MKRGAPRLIAPRYSANIRSASARGLCSRCRANEVIDAVLSLSSFIGSSLVDDHRHRWRISSAVQRGHYNELRSRSRHAVKERVLN
jgi:hypothetical protein